MSLVRSLLLPTAFGGVPEQRTAVSAPGLECKGGQLAGKTAIPVATLWGRRSPKRDVHVLLNPQEPEAGRYC